MRKEIHNPDFRPNILRRALTLGAGLSAMAYLALALGVGSDAAPLPAKTVDTPRSPKSSAVPYQGESDDDGDYEIGQPYHSQTATKVFFSKERPKTQFKAEKNFPKESYDAARKGIVFLKYSGVIKSGEKKGQLVGIQGTAWLAKRDGDFYYLVTNRHVVSNPDAEIDIKSVLISRSEIDKRQLRASVVGIAIAPEGYDAAVIKTRFDSTKLDVPLSVLEYEDNADLAEKRLLAVGFPSDFVGDNPLKASVWGDFLSVKEIGGYFIASGINGHGSSGSPAFVYENGKNVVKAMIYAGTLDKNGDVYIMLTPLNVDALIAEVDGK